MNELSTLPERVGGLEAQVLQLRGEMKVELSAIVAEQSSMRSELSAIQTQQSAVRSELAAIRAEIRAGDEETRRHARMLHEEVIDRLKRLQEGPVRGGEPLPKRSRLSRKS